MYMFCKSSVLKVCFPCIIRDHIIIVRVHSQAARARGELNRTHISLLSRCSEGSALRFEGELVWVQSNASAGESPMTTRAANGDMREIALLGLAGEAGCLQGGGVGASILAWFSVECRLRFICPREFVRKRVCFLPGIF